MVRLLKKSCECCQILAKAMYYVIGSHVRINMGALSTYVANDKHSENPTLVFVTTHTLWNHERHIFKTISDEESNLKL